MQPPDFIIAFMPTFLQGRAPQRLCSSPRVLQQGSGDDHTLSSQKTSAGSHSAGEKCSRHGLAKLFARPEPQQGCDASSILVLRWQVRGHGVPRVPAGVWGGAVTEDGSLWALGIHQHWVLPSCKTCSQCFAHCLCLLCLSEPQTWHCLPPSSSGSSARHR